MNIERILNMVIQQVMRRLVNKGIGAGINVFSKKTDNSKTSHQSSDSAQPADPQSAQAAKLAAKRARQAVRLGRRL